MGYKFNPLSLLGLDLVGSGGTTTWKPPVADSGSLPSSGNADGDVRVTLDTGHIWVWNDTISRWIDNSTLYELSVGTVPNVNGYSIAVDDTTVNLRTITLQLQPADATNPGIITTEAQTIAGSKTFSGQTSITDSTSSTDKNTGSLVIEGGIGVEENINVGGNATITGDLTVNGTTTTINTTTLDVTDANITINNGGNQASADLQDAGLTVEMSDATDAVIGYDSTLASKFKAGEVASEAEIVTVSHSQTITNKTIDADNNTISNLAHGAEVDDPSSGVHGVTGDIVGTTDAQSLSNKTIDVDNNTVSNIEVDNLKTGVLDTDINTVSASDDTIPSAKATKSYIDQEIGNHTHDTSDVISGTFVNARIAESNVTQHEAAINHDALLNFDSNDHVDHSTLNINTTADSGLTGGGDLTASRSLSVDIDGTTTETTIADNDLILMHDVTAGANRSITRSNLVGTSVGDISEQSATLLESQAATTIFTLNASVRSARIQISVFIDATVDIAEIYDVSIIYTGATYLYNVTSVGNTNVLITVNAAGAVQYTSTTYAGFTVGVIKYRAETTTI